MQEPDLEMKEIRVPSKLRVFYSGGRRGVSMLRWGGSSPAPPAPQCMPRPNKLPSYLAALPPESVCPSAPPQTGQTWLNTRASCPQPVGSAT